MKYSICKYKIIKDASSDFSINAELFTPDIVNLRNNLKNKNFKPLGMYAKYIKRGMQPEYSSNGTIKVLRSVNIRETGFSADRQEFVNEEFYNKKTSGQVVKNDVLLNSTGVGSLGRCCIVHDNEKHFIDGHITKIASLQELKPEFLYIYLNSKYGQIQIEKLYKGSSGQIEIYPEQIQSILIKPLKIQDLIAKIVKKVFKNGVFAKELYHDAQKTLLQELNLINWQPKHKLYSIKNYSEITNANRIDAEYFQTQYDEITEKIKAYSNGWDILENLIKINDKNIIPKSNIKYKYIELSNISKNGEITCPAIEFGENLPTRARRQVRINNVIVSSIEGSLDSIALITEKYDHAFCSNGFYVLTSEYYNPETLLCLMKSICGQLQLKKGCRGTILTAIGKDELNKIILPKIKNEVQEKIKEDISEMYKYKIESKQLLKIAKRGVEIAIEENENIATNWINEQLIKNAIKI